MDAHALTLFVDIVEAGNLSLAARNMKMSRANISYHLTQLERSVGMQLMPVSYTHLTLPTIYSV